MDETTSEKQFLRFSVRALLYTMVVLALLLTIGPRVFEWYFAIPSIPLADAVASFNARCIDDPVGKNEPPITETEIVASIRSQLPDLQASKQVKTIYSDIVRTRRLSADALHAIPGWELSNGTRYTVWWNNLDVPTGKNSGFSLRIRENNAPTAKPKDEPKLDRRNLIWITESSQ